MSGPRFPEEEDLARPGPSERCLVLFSCPEHNVDLYLRASPLSPAFCDATSSRHLELEQTATIQSPGICVF